MGGSRSVRLVAYALLVLSWAGLARAEPQASLGVTSGVALQGVAGPGLVAPGFLLGARADVLVLRDRNGQMAIGPYTFGDTIAFRSTDVGGGAEWLLPLTADVPLVLSGGASLRNGDGRAWTPGVDGGVFIGSRSFNFHSWYGLAAGVFVQTHWIPAPPATADLVFGIQLDAELFALPFLLVWGAIRGGA